MTKAIRDKTPLTKTSSNAASAACADCGRKWIAHNALAAASIHARSHGHRVEGRASLHVIYDGRGE